MKEKFKNWEENEFFPWALEQYDYEFAKKLWDFIRDEDINMEFKTNPKKPDEGILTIKVKMGRG